MQQKHTKKSDLASLKSENEDLDIGKLENKPVDLSKLSDVVKNEVIKNIIHDKLVKKEKSYPGYRYQKFN